MGNDTSSQERPRSRILEPSAIIIAALLGLLGTIILAIATCMASLRNDGRTVVEIRHSTDALQPKQIDSTPAVAGEKPDVIRESPAQSTSTRVENSAPAAVAAAAMQLPKPSEQREQDARSSSTTASAPPSATPGDERPTESTRSPALSTASQEPNSAKSRLSMSEAEAAEAFPQKKPAPSRLAMSEHDAAVADQAEAARQQSKPGTFRGRIAGCWFSPAEMQSEYGEFCLESASFQLRSFRWSSDTPVFYHGTRQTIRSAATGDVVEITTDDPLVEKPIVKLLTIIRSTREPN